MRTAVGYATMAAGIVGMLYALYVLLSLPWFILIASFILYAIGYNLKGEAVTRGSERQSLEDAAKRIPSHLH
jgi:uncharacterized membrane protein